MGLVSFLFLGLATWRLSSMLVEESGPWHIFTRLRKATGITHDVDEKIVTVPDKFLAGLLSCVWCCSVWVGAGWAILWLYFPQISVAAAIPFALSTAAIWIEKHTR
jgi:hypothetical protein